MNREFSKEFMDDLAYLLELCANQNTDTIELCFDINDKKLNVEMIFSINEDEL